jgi:hypothetical protein
MSLLTDDQLAELSDDSLVDHTAWIVRGDSRSSYRLVEYKNHGMKAAVWRVTDDVGSTFALKIIPPDTESGWNLVDEMTEARKLNPNYFAQVWSFGNLEIRDGTKSRTLSCDYKAVATDWVDGKPFAEYTKANPLIGEEFLLLVEQLFTALAVLRNNGLCHDDLHPGNVLIQPKTNPLTNEPTIAIKVIDTGSVKRIDTRHHLLTDLRNKIALLEKENAPDERIEAYRALLAWKEPDDHLRAVECLLYAANSLAGNYHRLQFWERVFFDRLLALVLKAVDHDLNRRLDDPEQVVSEVKAVAESSKSEETTQHIDLSSPFDYISAEMIRNDREFAELFSRECPWLDQCRLLEPLYIYGPRGCGKSSVLRWLSLKTLLSDKTRNDLSEIKDVGVYVSCSVELRSRFWLLNDEVIDQLQTPIIRFFNLLLLEELFDTLLLMSRLEDSDGYQFGFKASKLHEFTAFVIQRLATREAINRPRLQGQSYFDYLKGFVRKLRWDTWSRIQRAESEAGLPDPSLASDICRSLSQYFAYFESRHVTFLVDDYSNQRIPKHLQRKLNQTISFAKQGTPIFKVSSEYYGVDLEGIQEGREVVEINVGEQYTSLTDVTGPKFLTDIINIRLTKAKYKTPSIQDILGATTYDNMAVALAEENDTARFYYHGIDCIHWLCSGDVALALDLIKRIFDDNTVTAADPHAVTPHSQHETIQRFSHDEIHRIKSIVPDGEEMHDIVCWLGAIARAAVMFKRSKRKDPYKTGKPSCLTHLDVPVPVLKELQASHASLAQRYELLTSRAILLSLDTSRSRLQGATERLQMRRIYFPAFKAPLKRDAPIKVDTMDELVSMLSNPRTFAEREIQKAGLEIQQLTLAVGDALAKPRAT